jgi:hypothetical protein
MTPELKTACEVVFQEHKSLSQVKWNRETFHGRISIGLSEMAKETLVKKSIIFFPDKAKKIITLLNPAVAVAATYEEAVVMVANKTTAIAVSVVENRPAFIDDELPVFVSDAPEKSYQLLPGVISYETPVAEMKWYLKPVFYYILWPLCALIAGALIAFLLGLAYTELFLSQKQ